MTTDPLGVAYGMADSTTTLFVLVDGSPVDKVLLVDPVDGSYRSSWDAPDDEGTGLTYLGGSLYYGSNSDGPKRIYELDPSTGNELNNFMPQNPWGGDVHNNITALGNDGTDLLMANQDPWDQCLKVVNPSNGDSEGQFCPPFEQGLNSASGLAVTTDGDVVEARDGTVVHITEDQTFAITYDTSLGDVQGMAFVSSNLYMADDDTDTIYKTTVPSGVEITTDPRALAYRTVGATTTMFVLVEATPKDKVLLVDLGTGTLAGSYDGPDMDGQGLTYMGGSLYYAGRHEDGRARIYELDPDTGQMLSSITPRYNWGGEIFDEPRSLGNDGDNLLGYFGNDNCMQRIDPGTGDNMGMSCPQFFEQGFSGPKGVTVASDGSYFTAKNEEIAQAVLIDPDVLEVGRWSTTSTNDIEGMVFIGEVLYFADDDTDKVYKSSKPSGITNNPRGMAYDGTNLYILVDGALVDHVIVVDPLTGAVVTDFEAPHRETNGITYMDTQSTSTLFISATDEMPWGRQHVLHRVSPSDGAQLFEPIEIFMEDWVDGWYGLTNNGESLVLAPAQDGFVLLLDPDTGDFDHRTDLYGVPFFGFDAMAYDASKKDFLGINGDEVLQIDEDGRFLQSFSTALGNLRGAAMVGNVLYMADSQSRTVQAATIPAPPTFIGTLPKGMATDGTNLYLVVDGNPKDRVLILGTEPGQVVGSFEAPGDNVDSIAFHQGDVYVVTNEFHPFTGDLPPHVYRLASSTGAVLDDYEIQAPWGGILWDHIASLASDGTHLYAGRANDPVWFKIDPAAPQLPAMDIGAHGDFAWIQYVGSLEIAEAEGVPATLLSSGFSDIGQVITRFDPNSGEALDQIQLLGRSIEGMAYLGTVLYMADANTDMIIAATLKDNIPEITTVGDYTAVLDVVLGGVTKVSDPPAQFEVVRNTTVETEITEPLGGFATTTSVIPIQGRISDPAIQTVKVGVVLPFTNLLDDPVTLPDSNDIWDTDGLWYVDCSAVWNPPVHSSPPCAWRYGEFDQPSYGQGFVSAGSLTTKEPAAVGPNTSLIFDTWYETEPVPESDLKLVEVAVVTTDDDGQDVVGPYQALLQIVGPGFWGAPIPFDKFTGDPLFVPHAAFEHAEIEQASVDFSGGQPTPRFDTVHSSLQPFIGDRVMIRFRFDTVNDFANGGLGWFVDDIVIEGSGFKGQNTPVTPSRPARSGRRDHVVRHLRHHVPAR